MKMPQKQSLMLSLLKQAQPDLAALSLSSTAADGSPTAKALFPNFMFLDAPFNQNEKWRADDPKRYIYELATMGCRTPTILSRSIMSIREGIICRW